MTLPRPHGSGEIRWYLEGVAEDRRSLRRIPISPFPFRVGRSPNQTLSLNYVNVSREHAEITLEDGALIVRDLGSRNGTYVNLERISGEAVLRAGDIIHFGSCEFHVVCEEAADPDGQLDTMSFYASLPREIDKGTRIFLQVLEQRAVTVCYQPVVSLATGRRIGYEMLGRGAQPGFISLPEQLFKMAASLDLEDELSRAFRAVGIAEAARLGGSVELFVNVHPEEVRKRRILLDSLAAARAENPEQRLVVEIHESLVVEESDFRDFRRELDALGVRVAYDDFGTGQARLMELADSPPDYLKVDRKLITGLHEASPQRNQMLEFIVRFASESGIWTIAEGVESAAEAAVIRDLGFDYAQGFYFGRPLPLADYEP
ncbi:MAG: EAL domain-containing protein [Candidatus Sumerlaeaceae bacterium]|nr:EAL domain-containing protein [Candidatus Sumerlaeaceae bacterium]